MLSACKSSDADRSNGRADTKSSDPFKGEPNVTAQVHFLSGQLMESKITTPTANGRLPDQGQVAKYQAGALSQYGAALKLDPKHTPSLHHAAALLTNMKRHEAALAMWHRYVEATGRTPNSLVNLGLAYELAGRPKQAEQTYREATQIDPANKPAHVNLGILLAKQGQLQPAQAALAAVLTPAATHWHLGVALQAAGKLSAADQQFRAAAALDPAYAKRHVPLGGETAKIE